MHADAPLHACSRATIPPRRSPAARSRAGRGAAAGVLGALALALAACGEAPRPPHLVLVTIDTLRADRTSVYGCAEAETPTLDRLAAEGLVVDRAYAPIPTTLPSHASLFTSRTPLVHGVLRNGHALPSEHRLLAEQLADAGYDTAAFVSSYPLDAQFGLARGFAHYDDDFAPAPAPDAAAEGARREEDDAPASNRLAGETTDRALAWLAARDDPRPVFLWVHYFDPHAPYDAPPAWRARFAPERFEPGDPRRLHALYDAEVAYTDHELGRLLAGVDAALAPADTLLVVTSDHGEGLGDHDYVGHGAIVYEEALRVPLLLRRPGVLPAGARVTGPVEHLDLAPTLLTLLGLDAAALDPQGRDLADALRAAREPPPPAPMVFQRRLYEHLSVLSTPVEGVRYGGAQATRGPEYAVLHHPWKAIVAPEEKTRELYDLAADPGETDNLVERHEDKARVLDAALQAWIEAQLERGLGVSAEATREQLERLEALGYVK